MRTRIKRFLAALGLTEKDVRDEDLEVVSKALEAATDEEATVQAVADSIVERLEKSPRKLAALLRQLDDDEEDEDEDEEDEDEKPRGRDVHVHINTGGEDEEDDPGDAEGSLPQGGVGLLGLFSGHVGSFAR